MRRTGLTVIATLLTALAIAACGGQSASAAAISTTLKSWGTDFATYKDKAACALMSSSEQTALVKEGKKLKIISCPAVLRFDSEGLDTSDRKSIQNGSVSNVHVNGDTATAVFAGGTAKLAKVDGRWVIAGGLGG